MKTKVLILLCVSIFCSTYSQNNNYNIGVGISDITGQIAETNFFGYGNPFFKNGGIRDRQYARAFIMQEPQGKPAVFVVIDKGGVFQSVNHAVLRKLNEKFGDLITDENLIISATHTHVSPGGYSYYGLYDTATGGFYKTNFDIVVEGIFKAVLQAYKSMKPGRIYYNRGTLKNASINRSLVAYNKNKEANNFESIDPDMTVLKFVQGNKEVGMLSWFAVHPTSLTHDYKLCSGDNKGYAALKFEREKHSTYGTSLDNTFVAAFANTNAGDMSPNLNLPPKDKPNQGATGPGKNEEESSNIIGDRQFRKAVELYNSAKEQLKGSINVVSRYDDYSIMDVSKEFTDGKKNYSTCKAAIGLSFRAGAEDGRTGLGKEGEVRQDPTSGSSLDICHGYKPIDLLFNIGANDRDPKGPKILPTSIMKIGQLGILAAPAEFTVMAGRRSRQVVEENKDTGIEYTVFSGYSDAYAGYVTTKEEYDTQQYEGASTHFGPWTEAAYRQQFHRLAMKMVNPKGKYWPSEEPEAPIKKPVSSDKTVTVLFDDKPLWVDFGQVIKDAKNKYQSGETVQVEFWGAHPNNNVRTGGSYLVIQKLQEGKWIDKFYDRDTCTKLVWKRDGVSFSKIHINWLIPEHQEGGFYRIVHLGDWKNGWTGKISGYKGISKKFLVNENLMSDDDFANSGSSSEDLMSGIQVYPNPTIDNFKITNHKDLKGKYSVYNALGQRINKGAIRSKKPYTLVRIDGGSGMYILEVFYENGESYRQQILKRSK